MASPLTQTELDEIFSQFPQRAPAIVEYLANRRQNLQQESFPNSPTRVDDIVKMIKTEIYPRRLSSQELDMIIAKLPAPKAFTDPIRQNISFNLKALLRSQLSSIEITPLGIPDLIKDIQLKFHRAMSVPGEAVGVRAGEAMGQPITQMALNSFHVSGSAKNVSNGIEAIREVLRVTKDRKMKSMTISFEDKNLTFNDIFDLRGKLNGITVGRLIKDFDVIPTYNYDYPPWVTRYLQLSRQAIPQKSNYFLQLDMNPLLMYQYHITLPQIVKTIQKEVSHDELVIVPSPTSNQPVILIFPDEQVLPMVFEEYKRKSKDIKDMKIKPDDPNIGYIFIKGVILPILNNDLYITGIKGVQQIFPVMTSVWQIVQEELAFNDELYISQLPTREERQLHRRQWLLFYNLKNLMSTGIPPERLDTLIEYLGMVRLPYPEFDGLGILVETPAPPPPSEILESDQYVETPEENGWLLESDNPIDVEEIKSKLETAGYKIENIKDDANSIHLIYAKRTPGDIFRQAIDKAKMEKEETIKKGKIQKMPKPSKLEKLTYYGVADTNGSNMLGAFLQDEIDPYHTISNDFHEVYSILGVEAVRTLLLREFLDLLGAQGAYIDPRHLVLLVDVMTNSGVPKAINFNGVSKSAPTLAKASMERALEVFSSAAISGINEPVRGASASLYVGRRMNTGTGFFDLQMTEEYKPKQDVPPEADDMENALNDVFDKPKPALEPVVPDIKIPLPKIKKPIGFGVPKISTTPSENAAPAAVPPSLSPQVEMPNTPNPPQIDSKIKLPQMALKPIKLGELDKGKGKAVPNIVPNVVPNIVPNIPKPKKRAPMCNVGETSKVVMSQPQPIMPQQLSKVVPQFEDKPVLDYNPEKKVLVYNQGQNAIPDIIEDFNKQLEDLGF